MVGLVLLSCNPAQGQSPPPPDAPADEANEATVIHTLPKLDLGTFEIKNLELTRNLTTSISFDLHLSFPAETNARQLECLEHWRHRLREQIIVAVRVSDAVDFLDPQLVRFRRHILYRVNRILKPLAAAEEVLLADFTFSAS